MDSKRKTGLPNNSAAKKQAQIKEQLQAFPDEIEHLTEINRKLKHALEQAKHSVNQHDEEYRQAKRYMAQNRGEIDPHEMFQNELSLREIDSSGAFAVEIRDRIEKLKESPYFARVDFCNAGFAAAEKYYIGRFSFHYEKELLIFDWRAPVAGMFYDAKVGPAYYEAPVGRVEGKLTRKRQYKIQHGELDYVLESSVNIQDDVLQRELSQTSSDKMKSIISTIQKEQNQIIRNEKAKTMLIQGVAGSGKTSIALHRIAFLLYHYRKSLTAKNISIISPNKVFGDYISNVLPELGEEPIYEVSFADIAEVQLENIIKFTANENPFEAGNEQQKQRIQFKSTLEFVEKMDNYIKQVQNDVFVAKDYTFGPFTVEAEWIGKRYKAYAKDPVKKRLGMIAYDIYDRLETSNIMGDDLPLPKSILKALNNMLKTKNTLVLYKGFYQQLGRPELFKMPAAKTLEWNDVYPFLYLYAAFEGLQQSSIIRHLVIDEMQDYTPIQYAVINLLFPCQKTILGDFGQRTNANHLHTLEDIKQLCSGAEFVELNKSYRSTYEIITFAKRIQKVAKLEPIERHGEPPALIPCKNQQSEITYIEKTIEAFLQGGNASMGIILKTDREAEELHNILSQNHKIQLITPNSTRFINGVSVVSVQMSKGLEFDEVIIPYANEQNYFSSFDRSLLYIACTRAMHKLALTFTGECTKLIAKRHVGS